MTWVSHFILFSENSSANAILIPMFIGHWRNHLILSLSLCFESIFILNLYFSHEARIAVNILYTQWVKCPFDSNAVRATTTILCPAVITKGNALLCDGVFIFIDNNFLKYGSRMILNIRSIVILEELMLILNYIWMAVGAENIIVSKKYNEMKWTHNSKMIYGVLFEERI